MQYDAVIYFGCTNLYKLIITKTGRKADESWGLSWMAKSLAKEIENMAQEQGFSVISQHAPSLVLQFANDNKPFHIS